MLVSKNLKHENFRQRDDVEQTLYNDVDLPHCRPTSPTTGFADQTPLVWSLACETRMYDDLNSSSAVSYKPRLAASNATQQQKNNLWKIFGSLNFWKLGWYSKILYTKITNSKFCRLENFSIYVIVCFITADIVMYLRLVCQIQFSNKSM